jgi:hypothetical protein
MINALLKFLLPDFFKSETEKALDKCGGDCIPMRKGDE